MQTAITVINGLLISYKSLAHMLHNTEQHKVKEAKTGREIQQMEMKLSKAPSTNKLQQINWILIKL